MKVEWGSKAISPLILNTGTREVSDLHTPALYPQERTPLERSNSRLFESHSWSGRCCRIKNFLLMPGFKIRTDQPIASRYTEYTVSRPPESILRVIIYYSGRSGLVEEN